MFQDNLIFSPFTKGRNSTYHHHGTLRRLYQVSASVATSPNSTKLPVNNKSLHLVLSDVGVDDRGFWQCYSGPNDILQNTECWVPSAQWTYDSFNLSNQYGYAGAVFASVDISYWELEIFQTDPTLAESTNQWLTQGGIPPVLKDAQIGLHFRYSIDGTIEHQNLPNCQGVFEPPIGIKEFEYSFKTRLRLWNSRIKQLRVWVCDNSLTPTYASILNISKDLYSRGIKPLEPGPRVVLVLLLLDRMTTSAINSLQERLCRVVWTAVDERCASRVWTTLTASERSSGSSSSWQLTFTWLFVSNSRATRASYLLSMDVKTNEFRILFPFVIPKGNDLDIHVEAPGPYPKLNRESKFGCISHYDCDTGLFCSLRTLQQAQKGFQGSGGPSPYGSACDLCRYCLNDFKDPIDVSCPRDKCGPQTGMYPGCVDATKLVPANFTCRDRYILNMTRIPAADSKASIVSDQDSSTKARFLTPYNQLVGAVLISQKRLTGSCLLKNDSVGRYSSTKNQNLGHVCRGSQKDSRPFGADPAFSLTSTLYRGDFPKTMYYSTSELNANKDPFAFFPHNYDGAMHATKDSKYIMKGEEATFKLFFSEYLSATAVKRLMTFIKDGGFLDSQTEEVQVEFITLNSNLDLFAKFVFIFKWQVIFFKLQVRFTSINFVI